MDNTRNLLLAVVLCGLMLLGWDAGMRYFYPQPAVEAQAEVAASTGADGSSAALAGEGETITSGTREGGLTDPADIAQEEADLETELVSAGRIQINAPEVSGSINPVGARIDDITLKTHTQTVDKDSGPVRIFSPGGTPAQHFAEFGFIVNGERIAEDTVWQSEGGPLAPGNPVTLRHDNGQGQVMTIALAIDDHYMITAKQTIANTSENAIVARPFSLINRTSRTASADTWNVHSGPIGNFADAVQFGPDYDDLAEDSAEGTTEGRANWLGFTDIYWLSALVPQDGSDADTDFRSLGNSLFRADLIYQPVTVAAGRQVTKTTRLFAGAKESTVLREYEQKYSIDKFGKSIDWGWFEFIAWPIWWLLTHLFGLVGNFGVAIILLTVVIRGALFPIAQKQFASMAAMKAIQPKMKAIQERYKDNKQEQQQKIMALYKEEKVNPLAGCLPILIQIPIFFALYKTLLLSIEMRHQPFALWLKDLSAPDPAHILNLFGLLPFDVPSLLAIGPLAILLGITMWMTFKLNPTAMDPIQQQIFNIMPWMLMFVMAPFAAGLLLYWVTNNVLTIAQQAYLYSRHPQLKAAAEKEKADKAAAAAREAAG
ncbi:membrane protein insertase YidC [Pontixanthobacter sp.]|uniref:membrane protein insertase YidC n=1 Tax=Pontixanthobacter sp. TaxID=2792078 RepID=UPI003C7D9D47